MDAKFSFEKLPEAVSELTKEVSELKKIMLENRQQTPPTTLPDPLLNIQQAATFLSLTVNTLYTKVSKGELPAMKRGNRLYFSQSELMAYLKEGRKKTNAEIAAEATNYLKRKGATMSNPNVTPSISLENGQPKDNVNALNIDILSPDIKGLDKLNNAEVFKEHIDEVTAKKPSDNLNKILQTSERLKQAKSRKIEFSKPILKHNDNAVVVLFATIFTNKSWLPNERPPFKLSLY